MGKRRGRMGRKGTGNKKNNLQAKNRQGKVKNSGEANELICTTRVHELRGPAGGRGCRDDGGKGEKKWDNCNSIINKIYLKTWFAKFHTGDFSVDNTPRSGRPVKVNSDQIKTLIENNQHYTMQDIANILKISKLIKLLVKIKNVPFISRKKMKKLFCQPKSLILCVRKCM